MLQPNLYPLSTQDGQAIPLDVIRPTGLLWISHNTSEVLPDGISVIAIHANGGDAQIAFGNTAFTGVAAGVLQENILYVPINGVVIAEVVDPTITAYCPTATVYIQLMEKWTSLALAKQTGRK